MPMPRRALSAGECACHRPSRNAAGAHLMANLVVRSADKPSMYDCDCRGSYIVWARFETV